MLKRIIEWSVNHKWVILAITAVVTFAGGWAMLSTPVDAIPDLSDAQVIVMTEWPGQAPQIVEDQVTILWRPRCSRCRGRNSFEA